MFTIKFLGTSISDVKYIAAFVCQQICTGRELGVGSGSNKTLFFKIYSLILLSLVSYCFILLCIWLIDSCHRRSYWAFEAFHLGHTFLRPMPVRRTNCHGPYEGLILRLTDIVIIRMHGVIIIYLRKYNSFILPFSDFFVTFFLVF